MPTPADIAPPAGVPEQMAPGIRRILAPNPSPMTHWGTNTYLVGDRDLAVIDPGPDLDAHLEAILAAVPAGGSVSHILVTHAHLDHSPLAPRLARETGAPVLAYGDAGAGRSAVMQGLAGAGLIGGGEGVDAGFAPDRCLTDGETVHGTGWTLSALWTPGHFGNHLCFACGDSVFSGDLVMGWASSLVSPPDGDLTDFMTSCQALRARAPRVLYPGHGAPVTDPAARLDWLIGHRRSREAAILTHLRTGPLDIPTLSRGIYTDIPAKMMPAAERNVLAHLVDLQGKGVVLAAPELSVDAVFSLA
ncbi:MBL fold metallo-hydrolase [Paracoccus sp. (in: a-proteobacteria)]|uniref:MBL fold metallo-hydrolase n=1 Tax=Paracoccus sp. TaxID=267 RepID=UPI003A887E7E